MKKTTWFLIAALLVPGAVWAHCDRVDGPVAVAAREALSSGQPAKVLAWVGAAQNDELRQAYDLALKARAQGGAAADLAETYLVETAIRLHRVAEGLQFDGVQPAGSPLPRDLAVAEEALETGRVEPVLALLDGALDEQVRRLFAAARAHRAGRDRDLEAGREWVDAYVRYIVFVHGLHAAIEAGPEHGVGHAD